jgi:hypothetical protein
VSSASAFAQAQVRYVRYETAGRVSWGILENETTIRELQGSVFDSAKPTGRTVKLAEVKLLAPAEPKKVIAAGLNHNLSDHVGLRGCTALSDRTPAGRSYRPCPGLAGNDR